MDLEFFVRVYCLWIKIFLDLGFLIYGFSLVFRF